MKNKDIPIEQIEGFWYADSHIEEYPKEPTSPQLLWEYLKDTIRYFISKLLK